jgi:hypothetical protein
MGKRNGLMTAANLIVFIFLFSATRAYNAEPMTVSSGGISRDPGKMPGPVWIDSHMHIRTLLFDPIPVLNTIAKMPEAAGYVEKWNIPREWTYVDGTYPSKEELYDEMRDVLTRFPELRVTLAHFGFLSADPSGAAKLLDRFPNLCLDLTPGVEMYANFSRQPEVWRRFFTRYQDRLLFGTDNGYDCDATDEERIRGAAELVRTVRRFLETGDVFDGLGRENLKGLNLDGAVVAKIASGNFIQRIGGPPKPLDTDRAVLYCEWLYDRLYPDPLGAKPQDAVRARLAGILQLLRQAGGGV